MGIAIVEVTGKSVNPNTIMQLSSNRIVIFDFEALMQNDLEHWRRTIGGRPSFLAISKESPRNTNIQSEIILYSGEKYSYDEIRMAIGGKGEVAEIIGMVTVEFPMEHEGSICFLNREISDNDPLCEMLCLFSILIENITPRLTQIPNNRGILGEGRAHIIMNREWKGIIKIPNEFETSGRIAVDPQSGTLVALGHNGYLKGIPTYNGEVSWGNLNMPLSDKLIAQVIDSFTPTAQA